SRTHSHLYSFPTRRSSDLGPLGALPVMEGKAVLFKELAGVDAFPIVLDPVKGSAPHGTGTQEQIDFIVNMIIAISPGFGGINLEDRKSTRLNSSHLGISYA